MRKPLLALSLAVTTMLPAADALAASPVNASPGTSPPTGRSATNSAKPARAVSGAAIVQTAMQYLGYPYTATGNSPATGFSCIGFASFVFRQNGIPLPGDLQDALNYAPRVPFSDLMPGDLVFFQNTVWAGLSHVGIYIGGGKFIHAEWYNTGVVISSLSSSYYSTRFLAANRPWTGAAVSPVVSGTPNGGATTAPATTTQTGVTTGPTAVVTVPSLNVRAKPSMSATILEVISRGTDLTVLGHKGGWYKVRLPDGTVGWVVAAGLGLGNSTPAANGQNGPSTSSSTTGSSTTGSTTAGNTTTGNTTAPARRGYPSRSRTLGYISIRVNGLLVHSSPSTSAPVITSLYKGQRMPVLAYRGGWIKVRLSGGTAGWVSAAYTSARAASGQTSATRRGTSTSRTTSGFHGRKATVAMNVRASPSLQAAILTTVPVGGLYRIFGWSGGWAHVQLPSGTIGWISGTVFGASSNSATPSYQSNTYRHTTRTTRRKASTQGGSVLTAGVRVHSRPGIKAPVVVVAAAGTHVTVLGYSGGWVLVRLPSGQTGYVLGTYVR